MLSEVAAAAARNEHVVNVQHKKQIYKCCVHKIFLLCYYDFRGSNLFSILAFSLAQLFPDTLSLNEKSGWRNDFSSHQERELFRGD